MPLHLGAVWMELKGSSEIGEDLEVERGNHTRQRWLFLGTTFMPMGPTSDIYDNWHHGRRAELRAPEQEG